MTWSRSQGIPPHTARAVVHSDPTAIVVWSSWDGAWSVLTASSMDETTDLDAWCSANGLPVVSAADVDWLREEDE